MSSAHNSPLPCLSEIELLGLMHGTTEVAADAILRDGFDPGRGQRSYGFAEWGFGSVYLGRKSDVWYGPETVESGRRSIGDPSLVRYEVILDVEIMPTARIFRIMTPADGERLARAAGFTSFSDLKSEVRADPSVFPGRSEAALGRLRSVGLDGVEVRMREWHALNSAIANRWTALGGPVKDPALAELRAAGWSDFSAGPDQIAVFNPQIVRAIRRHVVTSVAGPGGAVGGLAVPLPPPRGRGPAR